MKDTNRFREAVISALLENAPRDDRPRLEALRNTSDDLAFEDLRTFESLEAIEISMRLEEEFDIDIDLANFVESPTVNGFAAKLEALAGGPVAGASKPAPLPDDLVCLKPGDGSAPLFCIHGGGGEVMTFGPLAAALPDAQAVYGLKMRGVDGTSAPHDTIEAMAADYVAAVRTVSPSGPYHLLGYSAGGVIAYEMAQQLTSAGLGPVGPIMIDTLCPTIHSGSMTMIEKMGYAAYWNPVDMAKRLATMGHFRRVGKERQQKRAEIARLLDAGQQLPHALRYQHVADSLTRAHRSYRPRRWDGATTLIRARRRETSHFRGGRTLGWSEFIGGEVSVSAIDADHHTILDQPAVDGIASLVSEAMNSARG